MNRSIYCIIKKHSTLFCFFLILFGIIIRFLGISLLPGGLNQDEASIGYETFSLLQDGFDRNGIKYPVHFISWGNGQNALYAYLSMPFVKLFGLNSFSVRFLNALLSSISLLVFYLFFKEAFNKKKALVALSFFVICPWSIMSARWGLESNIFPAIFLIAVFFLLKGITRNQIYFLLSAVFFSLCLYAYGPSYLVVPIFFLFFLSYLLYFKKISLKYILLSFGLFLFLSLPMILFVIVNQFDLDPMRILGLSVPKMLTDRTADVFNLFTGNFILNLIKNIVRFFSVFFLQTDNFLFNAIPVFGLIYHISLPFFFIGFYGILKNREYLEPANFIMLSWFVCSVILGITIHANINRVNILIIPMIYFVILGIIFTKEQFSTIKKQKRFSCFLSTFYMLSFMFFIGYYVTFFNKENRNDFFYGLGDAICFVNEKYPEEPINITTHSINMPYIHVCFFSQTDPNLFRETVVYDKENLNGGFRNVLSFDRFNFLSNAAVREEVAVISKNEFLYSDISNREYREFGNYYVLYPVVKRDEL